MTKTEHTRHSHQGANTPFPALPTQTCRAASWQGSGSTLGGVLRVHDTCRGQRGSVPGPSRRSGLLTRPCARAEKRTGDLALLTSQQPNKPRERRG